MERWRRWGERSEGQKTGKQALREQRGRKDRGEEEGSKV